MNKNDKPKLIPRLRFPEFQQEGEWEIMKVENLLKLEISNLTLNKLTFTEVGYPVYGAEGIIGYIKDFQQNEQYISIIKDGAGVGRLRLCEDKSSVLGTLSILKVKDKEKYELKWIYYLLHTINLKSYIKGSGIPHIYFSDYKKEIIKVPSLSEQQKIAACLSSLDELIEAQREKIELLKLHKKGLLQGLFPEITNL
ncbi:MAG: restriction endonuclease subunit S [Cytophagales bacterium]|nr:restriction endonuclease subunit S [Cytophagales bacterium]MDW8384299.1 restriction endonuclease subunit S [Flammeovirgaceae bacterium]